MNTTVYCIGIVLQGLAAAIALVQIRRAPHKLPWLCVAISSLLIAIRRVATVGGSLWANWPLADAEIVTLGISVLFLAGVILMSRMFGAVAASQKQLRENQQRLDLAMEASRAGTWEWDVVSNEVHWSPELWALFGLDPGVPPSYQAWRDAILPEDREQAEHAVQAAALEGSELAAEWRVRNSDGKIVWLMSRGKPVRDGNGTVRKYLGVAIDISTRKQAEQAAREADLRRKATFDCSPYGMLLVDPVSGRILEFNDAAHRMAGYTREEFTGLSIMDIAVVESAEEIRSRFDQILQQGVLEFETPEKTKQGKCITITINSTVLEMEGAKTFFCILRDITEQRETEQKLVQSQKMEAIGQLAGGVAHDFRNQLTVIQGFAEMLRRRNLVDPNGSEMLQEILNASERSAVLTGQLLAFSRKQILQPSRVDLVEAVTDLSKMIPRMAGEDIRCILVPSARPCHVEIDLGQFQQAMVNLVVNARDAMPTGGQLAICVEARALPTALLKVHPQAEGRSFVAVAVTDTGCGMDETVKAHIFEPFYTTKEVGQGTGLGLPMVYGFVEQSGGYLDVDSEPGRGTTVTLYFPEVKGPPVPLEAGAAASGKTPGGTETILLVEDDPGVRQVMTATLEEAGYTIVQASSAQEAYAALRENTGAIRLLLTDVVMPGTGGVEMVQKVRQEYPALPVLYMSGYPERELTRRQVWFAAGHLLSKPINYNLLQAKVREFLDAGGPGPDRGEPRR